MKEKYVSPKIIKFYVLLESSISSTSSGMLNFKGNNGIEPDIEDWTDNTTNTDKFDREFLF